MGIKTDSRSRYLVRVAHSGEGIELLVEEYTRKGYDLLGPVQVSNAFDPEVDMGDAMTYVYVATFILNGNGETA
jgi:hypothetical protein